MRVPRRCTGRSRVPEARERGTCSGRNENESRVLKVYIARYLLQLLEPCEMVSLLILIFFSSNLNLSTEAVNRRR